MGKDLLAASQWARDTLLQQIQAYQAVGWTIPKKKSLALYDDLESLKQSILSAGAIEQLTVNFWKSKIDEFVSLRQKLINDLRIIIKKRTIIILILCYGLFISSCFFANGLVYSKSFQFGFCLINSLIMSTLMTLFTAIFEKFLEKREKVFIDLTIAISFLLLEIIFVFFETYIIYPKLSIVFNQLVIGLAGQNIFAFLGGLLLVMSEISAIIVTYFTIYYFLKKRSENKNNIPKINE